MPREAGLVGAVPGPGLRWGLLAAAALAGGAVVGAAAGLLGHRLTATRAGTTPGALSA